METSPFTRNGTSTNPSSMNTTVKYINHAASISLDSSDAFEGPEKLLKLCFTPLPACEQASLLKIPRQKWEAMLDIVHCKVLSVVSSQGLDSYVLSESSMFVYPRQLVLKTCGTTTLLEGLDSIREIAASCGLNPSSVLYSRRSFLFPSMQLHPHGSWQDEVSRLRVYWPQGTCSQFGTSPEQRWHLFTYYPPSTPADSGPIPGQWIELMMTGLDPQRCQQFHLDHSQVLEDSVVSLDSPPPSVVGADPDDDDPGHLRGNIMTRVASIDELYECTSHHQVIDSFAFNPCGYSCNGIVDSNRYFTIHVTPETGMSYASFETNTPKPSPQLINKVLSVFEPEQFAFVACDTAFADNSLPYGQVISSRYACTSEARVELRPGVVVTHMTFVRSL